MKIVINAWIVLINSLEINFIKLIIYQSGHLKIVLDLTDCYMARKEKHCAVKITSSAIKGNYLDYCGISYVSKPKYIN